MSCRQVHFQISWPFVVYEVSICILFSNITSSVKQCSRQVGTYWYCSNYNNKYETESVSLELDLKTYERSKDNPFFSFIFSTLMFRVNLLATAYYPDCPTQQYLTDCVFTLAINLNSVSFVCGCIHFRYYVSDCSVYCILLNGNIISGRHFPSFGNDVFGIFCFVITQTRHLGGYLLFLDCMRVVFNVVCHKHIGTACQTRDMTSPLRSLCCSCQTSMYYLIINLVSCFFFQLFSCN